MTEIGKIKRPLKDKSQKIPEVPEFIIETDEDSQQEPVVKGPSRRRTWLLWAAKLLVLLCVMAAAIIAYGIWKYYYKIGLPVSVSPAENIIKLKQPAPREIPEVVLTTDTVLGVELDFYTLHGLKACLEFEEPDTADTSVYLYSRSADHSPDNSYLGSLVVNGVEKQSDMSRLGYMGMVGNSMVIGVSRSEKVKDYCEDNGGHFFRQFILVSDGVLPARFFLHGKVERRAIGRLNDRIVYVASRNRESMWDFADALREYGFTDAIYITGGNDYSFYRTADGSRHDISDVARYPHTQWKGIVPWLVFRKAE